jgi:hypothetical protein
MWILLIIAINVNNPVDPEFIIRIPFESERACKGALNNTDHWIKSKSYKMQATCKKQSYL